MPPSWTLQRRQTRAEAAGLLPLAGLAWLYGAAARLHRHAYRSGALEVRRFSGHVLSVGNLTLGGTGKTPTAAWVARELHRRGRKVVIASRGYGGRRREDVVVVSDGRYVRSRTEQAGDEALVLAAHAPGVPVLVGRDRGRVALRALAAFGADVLVLDDGFQHHRLHRDLDIVTLDGSFGFGNGWLLPRGPLREPLSALAYAHAVGVVDGPLPAGDAVLIQRFSPLAYRFAARRRPLEVRRLEGGAGISPASLEGSEVGLLAGLGQPTSLRRTIESLGARVVAERRFRDHHRYRPRDLAGLARAAPLWITTEKDALKIVPAWAGRADIRVLAIEIEVAEAPAFLDWIETRLR